jgi:outer membrane receptor protein involved in Fe transport
MTTTYEGWTVQAVSSQKLFEPTKLSMAIGVALTLPTAAAVAQENAEAASGGLEEVLVTARKRTESLMDIPQSIQAISEGQIKKAGLYSMEDYVRFIPSMSYVQANPGTAKIIFRGIADDAATFIAEPSAALYLDEQSLTMNGTPDPRMVDVERVEALSGPQGTLYGASSQSGTLRIVTNKPDPTAFDANIDLMLKSGSDSDMSYDASAMVNLPINDRFAIRLVGFSAEDGGFIDNINGDTPRFGLFNNRGAEKENFNDVRHGGGRISAKWFINDDWSMTAGVIGQNTYSHGRPEQDSSLGRDLAVVRFFPEFEFDDMNWTQYSLTFEGDLGFADFVSATSYFTRDWSYAQDTSVGYASYFGTFCYDFYYNGVTYDGFSRYSKYCFQPEGVGNYYNDPIGWLLNVQENTKFSQEFRLSSQGERIDWVAGLFYEDSSEDWDFWTYARNYSGSKSFANLRAGNGWKQPDIPEVDTDFWWHSADRTDWEQKAVFGEITVHLTDKLDLTGGARYFDRTMDKLYWVETPAFLLSQDGYLNPTSDESDTVYKFSLSYQLNDDTLLYGLYSEGFRPGGTNRGRGIPFFPRQYDSDILENFELGAKMTLLDGRARLNATYFDMSWDDYQLEVVDPSNRPCGSEAAPPEPACGQPWQKVVANVGKASSKGLELQFDLAASQNLDIGANATWLDATLDEDVSVSVVVPAGSRLPLSPEWKGSVYANYDWTVDWFGGAATNAYFRVQWSYTGDMLNIVEPIELYEDGPSPQLKQPSYNIGDIKFGVTGDDWSVQLFVNNVTDERAILFANPFEFDYFFGHARETVNRPREYGIRYTKSFSR